MKKRIRQYIGLLSAVFAYYAVHEGAHLIYALTAGVFRQINFMGIGMQIGIYEERMSDTDKLYISVSLENTVARKMYASLGFKECKEIAYTSQGMHFREMQMVKEW